MTEIFWVDDVVPGTSYGEEIFFSWVDACAEVGVTVGIIGIRDADVSHVVVAIDT